MDQEDRFSLDNHDLGIDKVNRAYKRAQSCSSLQTNTSMDIQKRLEVKLAVEEAIKETNRCLYTWKTGSMRHRPKDLMTPFKVDEFKGLFNNWMSRCLKSKMGWRSLRSIFRDGTPSISVSEDREYVTGIFFPTPEYSELCSRATVETHLIKDIILKDINFLALRFDPKSGTHGSTIGNPPWEEPNRQKKEIFHKEVIDESDILKPIKLLGFSNIFNVKQK